MFEDQTEYLDHLFSLRIMLFVTNNLRTTHPMSNDFTYEGLSRKYRAFLSDISKVQKPKFFIEASNNPDWVGIMKQEILSLEENKTW